MLGGSEARIGHGRGTCSRANTFWLSSGSEPLNSTIRPRRGLACTRANTSFSRGMRRSEAGIGGSADPCLKPSEGACNTAGSALLCSCLMWPSRPVTRLRSPSWSTATSPSAVSQTSSSRASTSSAARLKAAKVFSGVRSLPPRWPMVATADQVGCTALRPCRSSGQRRSTYERTATTRSTAASSLIMLDPAQRASYSSANSAVIFLYTATVRLD